MLISNFLLDLFFPRFCINCGSEGSYLCQDCFSLIDFSENLYCPFCYPPKISFSGKTCDRCQKKGKNLKGLISAVPYQNFIIKKIIAQFKYEPYIKTLAKTLAVLIVHHLQLIEKQALSVKLERPGQAILIPVPLTKRRLKERGFNQAEEIGKELSKFLTIPLVNNALIKIKETLPQVELAAEARKENIKGAFLCKEFDKVNPVRDYRGKKETPREEISNGVKDKKILLVDDVFTTGSTMEECARLLKEAGAKEVWGITVARE